MRRILLASATLLFEPALAEGPTSSGQAGLLAIPSAEIQQSGTASVGWGLHDPLARPAADVENWFVTVGFLPGLEIGGRIVEDDFDSSSVTGTRDLSFNAKYRLELPAGIGVAIGAQDIGGEVQFFETRYAVATLPWHSLKFTAGYGTGPDVLDGAFGGIEWRPWSFIGLLAEHDTEDFNGGVKLLSGDVLWGARLGATAAYRGANAEVEYGAHVEFPLGRRERGFAGTPSRQESARIVRGETGPTIVVDAEAFGAAENPSPARSAGDLSPPVGNQGELRTALVELGFEEVYVGQRPPATQVVRLENRRYNHSAADAIGLALGVIAARSAPGVERIELTLFAYGVPQVTVTAPAALYRAFLANPAAHAAELRGSLVTRSAAGIERVEEVAWDHPERTQALAGAELVIEPLLRTFIATEYGVLDYSLGARLRLTAPLGRGLLVHAGAQVPLVDSDDFRTGGNFEPVGVEAGIDQLTAQYAHKLHPQWTWLWSLGHAQVFRTDLDMFGLEQLWLSGEGTHQLRAKLMALHAGYGTRGVALAGYTWYDPARDYSVSLTGGRFYAEDSGFRLELNRYVGDTIVGLTFRAATRDDMAAGIQFTLPLTPRRDAMPGGLQVKGARRWGHSSSTTLNSDDGRNPLRPLLLYEPSFDLDLRRDFYDSGRLGGAYLREQLPRMHEAYELWGRY